MSLARSRALLLAIAAAAALAVAGCGDDEEEPAAEDTAAQTEETATEEAGGQPDATLQVSEVDYEIQPKNAKIDEDGLIEIELTNDGQSPHALEIEAEEEFVSDTINPGDSTTFTAQLDSGEYVWYCPVGNHRELGMEGTIAVGGGNGGSDDDSGGGATTDDDQTETEAETETQSGDDDSGGSSPY